MIRHCVLCSDPFIPNHRGNGIVTCAPCIIAVAILRRILTEQETRHGAPRIDH